jgi:hypothetical protein
VSTGGVCTTCAPAGLNVTFRVTTAARGINKIWQVALRSLDHNDAHTTHNDAHTTPSAMSSNATLGVETRAHKRKRERLDANAANAGDAIPGLLNDIVVTHVLRSELFDDPADLARLPAVSRAMRDAVAATGLRFEELGEANAVKLGCVSALHRLQRGGSLQNPEYLCHAAALSGQLEELKLLRENYTPWDIFTCSAAAWGGHLEVLQWSRANGCPWDWQTCCRAAGGNLDLLQWARENGCPWDEKMCSAAASKGHLDVLQWARANGCPWDMYTCSCAAYRGHLEVLQWLRANGCPWNEDTIGLARANGYDDVVIWAKANGAPE